MATISDLGALSREQLVHILASPHAPLPELIEIREHSERFHNALHITSLLAEIAPLRETLTTVPQTTYTDYRRFRYDGDRKTYETPYFRKRVNLAVTTLLMLMGEEQHKHTIQDHLWSICEESNWVLPAHEYNMIDLFAAETGFWLAEVLHVLDHKLDIEVRHRVKGEIERRILDPYLRFFHKEGWYKGHNNWNSVCNSSVAATFLLIESDPERAAQGIHIALQGLQVFLDTAFTEDGCSDEGVGYWNYGLINFVALAELLYAKSAGEVNLLNTPRMRTIASYPARVQLSPGTFASFSDSGERIDFYPGMITRLAERTGVTPLYDLLVKRTPPVEKKKYAKFAMLLRNALWSRSLEKNTPQIVDEVLPSGGVARIVLPLTAQAQAVLAIKAGHNDESHNQNDIASFILHIAGENLLTDPGAGLYTRDYFNAHRYENIFANSYGHSVPRIAGQLQSPGKSYYGELHGIQETHLGKRVEVAFAHAYPLPQLTSALRTIGNSQEEQILWLRDEFLFANTGEEIEEAFVTWQECKVDGNTATVYGTHSQLVLTIEQPANCIWQLQILDEASKTNQKPGILKRLSAVLPIAQQQQFYLRITSTLYAQE